MFIPVVFGVSFIVFITAFSQQAVAQTEGGACTSAGSSVEITSTDTHTRLVCNGTIYKKMESWNDSGWREVNMGSPTGFSPLTTACNSTYEGRTVYDKTRHIMLLCNGTAWQSFGISVYVGP